MILTAARAELKLADKNCGDGSGAAAAIPFVEQAFTVLSLLYFANATIGFLAIMIGFTFWDVAFR